MCDPLTLTGLALSTAGGMASASTERNYANAVNSQNQQAFALSRQAREAERVRQQRFEAQGADRVDSTIAGQGADDFEAARAGDQQAFTDLLASRTPALTEGSALPGTDRIDADVRETIASQAATAAAETRARVQNLSRLQSFGGAFGERGRERAGAGDFLSMLGGLRRGSLAVAGQEQDVRPGTVTRGSNLLGDLLTGAGAITSMGAGMGTNPWAGLPGQLGNIFNIGGAGAAGLAPSSSLRPMARPAGLGG